LDSKLEVEVVMPDLGSIRFICSNSQELISAVNSLQRVLSPEVRKAFREIAWSYTTRFGLDGAFERLNNRSIAQILADYDPRDMKVITSGEMEGVRYTLYEAPSARTTKEEPDISKENKDEKKDRN
jgi:hypothetical protein